MPDSGYFNGTEFRGIDEDATRDEAPFSSALEGRMVANSAWLHANAGGSSVRRFIGSSTAVFTSESDNRKHSAVWTIFHQQLFLFTKGLSKIKFMIQATVQGVACDFALSIGEDELVENLLWTLDATATPDQQFLVMEYTFPESFKYDEYLLINLCAKSRTANLPSFPKPMSIMSINNGYCLDNSTGILTDTTNRAIILYNSDVLVDPVSFSIVDPIFRVDDIEDMATISPAELGSTRPGYVEIEIAYVTMRSLAIKQEFV